MVLAIAADPDGGNCYPSTRTLAERTGLSRRTVETHLRSVEGRWIERRQLGEGQGWRRTVYSLLIPSDVEQQLPHVTPEGGATASPRQGERGENDDMNVGKQFPTTSPIDQPKKETSEFEDDVRQVFDLCRTLRAERIGKVSGPPLQLTDGRASKIRARCREGFTRDYLEDCARGFYADDWKDRDKYLDPIYAFKTEETVRRFAEQYRNGAGGDEEFRDLRTAPEPSPSREES